MFRLNNIDSRFHEIPGHTNQSLYTSGHGSGFQRKQHRKNHQILNQSPKPIS